MSAAIIEETETSELERIVTVRTERGDEFSINLDEAAKALADLFSDYDNEMRFGWTLGAVWYRNQLDHLRTCSLSSDQRP